MKRQIALLRGINVSGKNKVPMAELKEGFEELGFQEVKTYLNSGNVIFSSDGDDVRSFANQIEANFHGDLCIQKKAACFAAKRF